MDPIQLCQALIDDTRPSRFPRIFSRRSSSQDGANFFNHHYTLFVASPLQVANSASASALANKPRTSFSDPPTQRSNSSGADTILGVQALRALEI
jgi:hypothetical protein